MTGYLTRDLVYSNVDGVALSATLYTPVDVKRPPAVVEIHGGAWHLFDRTRNAALCDFLASAGIMVLALDFRAPPHVYPASVADVNAGIRWLKHHVASLGGDPHSVGGIGASSGGHLLLLNGLRPQAPEYRGDPRQKPDLDARLRFMVACWPIVDPLARYQMAVSRGLKSLVMAHEQYWDPPGAMETGNPQGILNTGAYSNLPELMIVQGTEDANMTPEMIHRFVASYREAGGTVKLHSYDGQPHDFFVAAPGSRHVKAAMAEIRDFILANNS